MSRPGESMRFCPDCGALLELRATDGRLRAFCPACGRVHYEHLNVGAGVLVERDGRLLLLRRAHAPFAGCWNLPAGYVEVDESPAQAAEREAREETGLDVEVAGLAGVYHFADDPRGNGILIVYRCRVAGGALSASAEAGETAYFPPDRIPPDLAGGGHNLAILAWKSAR